MASTTKAVKQATELKISTVGDFKKRLGGITELPSGLVVRLHNPGGLAAFMNSKSIPNGLMPIVSKQLKIAKEGGSKLTEAEQEEKLSKELETELESNPELLLEMSNMLDSVVLRCLVEPKVHAVPTDGVERDDELLYVDELESVDKQFIYSWLVSGVTDLESFRNRSK